VGHGLLAGRTAPLAWNHDRKEPHAMKTIPILLAALLSVTTAHAAELTVFAATPFVPVLADIVPGFEARTHDTVKIVRDTAGGLAKRIEKGDAFDLAIVGMAGLETLTASGRIAAGSAAPLAKSGIGMAVKEGAPKPDISTVEAFKHTLLGARAVAYSDPAFGGTTGIYLSKLFERLGIADAIAAKAVKVPGGLAAERIVSGEADIALQQMGEVMAVKGTAFLGPLPPDIQFYTVFGIGIAANTAHGDSVRALLADLRGDAAARSLAHHGMDKP
jgi:molybdate transport system substrate-binding protein